MHRPPPLTFARFVSVPENRSALAAVQQVAADLVARRPVSTNPLYLYGPAGSGKTHLVTALVEEVSRRLPGVRATVVSAADFVRFAGTSDEAPEPPALQTARSGDLLVVEDLQRLPARAAERLVQTLDEALGRGVPVVVTALAGPGQLGLPARLGSRLAAGLVVGIEPLQAPSRLALLQDKAQRRQLAVGREVLAWLADNVTGGGRQLEGALARLETLARGSRQPPDVAAVARHFGAEVEATRPTVERIAQRVGRHFGVEPRQMQSKRRSRQVVLPRQVGMYLARRLTGLSLGQIGAYFGGRDHSTVLHACQKVEQVLENDTALGGTVRQLQADLA